MSITRPPSSTADVHHRSAKMLGRHSRAAEHEKAHYKKAKDQRKKAKWTDPNVPDGYGLTEHDKMVSVDMWVPHLEWH